MKPKVNLFRTSLSSAPRQTGAVLYVAMIMLVLLALLGIVGMQVSGMQERMSASYRAVNRAFQNSEGYVRRTECGLERYLGVNRAGCTAVASSDIGRCDDGFDAASWVRDRVLAHAPARHIRQLEPCLPLEADIGMGGAEPSAASVFQITVYDTDTADEGGINPSSAVAVDTVFIF